MSKETKIKWCDSTFNLVWGCAKIDPGCTHCFAETLATRYGFDIWGPNKSRRTFGPKYWRQPLLWNARAAKVPGVMGPGRRHLVFCSSMADVFELHPTVTQEREKLWPLIAQTPNLNWLLLTKRADQMVAEGLAHAHPRIWWGVSVSEPKGLWRVDMLRKMPGIKFVSYEPALAPIHLDIDLTGIDWLISGGESGKGFRRDSPEWHTGIQRACMASHTAYFYKQSSAPRPGYAPLDLPREFPKEAT